MAKLERRAGSCSGEGMLPRWAGRKQVWGFLSNGVQKPMGMKPEVCAARISLSHHLLVCDLYGRVQETCTKPSVRLHLKDWVLSQSLLWVCCLTLGKQRRSSGFPILSVISDMCVEREHWKLGKRRGFQKTKGPFYVRVSQCFSLPQVGRAALWVSEALYPSLLTQLLLGWTSVSLKSLWDIEEKQCLGKTHHSVLHQLR